MLNLIVISKHLKKRPVSTSCWNDLKKLTNEKKGKKISTVKKETNIAINYTRTNIMLSHWKSFEDDFQGWKYRIGISSQETHFLRI